MIKPDLISFDYETVTVDHQGQVVARQSLTGRKFTEPLEGAPGLDLVEIPAGRFRMGSPRGQGYDDERPQHNVQVASFFIGAALITQAQWQAVMGRRPHCRFVGSERSAENVAWPEVQTFCRRLSHGSGRVYQLPSEAQWEYACRAGTNTPFYCGETLTAELANYCGEHTYRGERAGPYRHTTTFAGTFPPNPFGLYDMHGNLWQWCADAWHADYEGAPAGAVVWDTRGDPGGRVVRGGSWHDTPDACRSAARTRYEAGQGDDFVGFRVVFRPDAAPAD